MTRFTHFTHSPYHNKHRAVQQLVDYLSTCWPAFSEEKIETTYLLKKAFPKEPKAAAQLPVLLTYATRLLEQFLIAEKVRETPVESEILLLEQLRSRGLHRWFEKKWSQALQKSSQELPKGSLYYWYQWQLATEGDYHFAEIGRHQQDGRLQTKQEQLDHFFLSEKLKDACEMLIRKAILRVEFDQKLLSPALEEIAGSWEHYREQPVIAIYYQIYRLLDGQYGEPFEDLLQFIGEREEALPFAEVQNVYNYLQNYCIGQVNRGDSSYLKRSFAVFQLQLNKGLLLVNGTLPEWHYKNIVTIGLRVKEFTFIRAFIEDYRTILPIQQQETAYSFNLASYYYESGQPEKVLKLLAHMEYSDFRYYMGAKSMLLRTYYDLQEEEAMDSLAAAFKQYLKRNQKMAGPRLQAFERLLNYTRKAMGIRRRIGFSKKEVLQKEFAKLDKEVAEQTQIINRNWLLSRVELLAEELR
ncbi:MAG: hypothetical protein AAFU60_01365 [Bacteroidota bacterium]